jgi:hypothetical protein
MKTLIKILLLTSVFLIVLFSCKKEQLEIKKTADPCECASEVSADFEILEHLRNGVIDELNVFTPTDHILGNKRVSFRAKIDDAEYKWYIGVEELDQREVNRYFPEQLAGQSIPITLVVKKDPNKICFPNDDGYDSIVKFMNVYDRCDTNHLEGNFRIAEIGTKDSFDIKLDIRGRFDNNIFEPTVCSGLDIYNYDSQGSECVMDKNFEIIRNYRYFKISSGPAFNSNCTSIFINSCTLDFNNKFSFHYQYKDQNSNNITLITKGRKL